MSSESRIFLLGGLLATCLLVSSVFSAAVHPRRAVSSIEGNENSSRESKICHALTPCGWAVYIPFTRRIDYFMQNTCVCEKGMKCLETDDDLSVSAYVYRCREAGPGDADSTSLPFL